MKLHVEYLDELQNKAHDQGKRFGLDTKTNADGNVADAFRHTFASAIVTRDHGAEASQDLGDLNEIFGPGGHIIPLSPDNEMDRFNNTVGQQIGATAAEQGWSDDQVADAVHAAIQQHDTINNVDDYRTWEGLDETIPMQLQDPLFQLNNQLNTVVPAFQGFEQKAADWTNSMIQAVEDKLAPGRLLDDVDYDPYANQP